MDKTKQLNEELERIEDMKRADKRFPSRYVANIARRTPRKTKRRPHPEEITKIVATSRYESVSTEFWVTIAFLFSLFFVIGGVIWLVEWSTRAQTYSYIIANLVRVIGGIAVFVIPYHFAPYISIMSTMFGPSLLLLPDNEQDQKLARVIEHNPDTFSTEWMRAWADGTKEERGQILGSLHTLASRYRAASKRATKLENTIRRRKRDLRRKEREARAASAILTAGHRNTSEG